MKARTLLLLGCAMLFSIVVNAQESVNKNLALEYIQSNSKDFNLIEGHSLELRFVRKSLSGETLRFQHTVNDVPVFNSEIVINFNKKNEVAYTSSNYKSNISSISTTPEITSDRAVDIADARLNYKEAVTFQESKLYVLDFENATKLVYRVVTSTEDLPGSWEVLIDASTSEILSVKDIAIYCGVEGHSGHKLPENTIPFDNKVKTFAENHVSSAMAFESGTAMVFLSDPLSSAQVAYGATGFTDGFGGGDTDTAQLNAQRASVVLPQIENLSGTYKLKSSYVEIKNLENPNKGLFTQTTSDFNFTRSQDGFEAANVFYHTDNSLRYINETLGVNCIQNVASSHAGILWYDPSGLNGADNSYYSNGQLVFGEGCVDDGEDGDVIWHELGHGLHDWLTGGSLSQVNGLSEGSGDYWAQSHSRALGQWPSTAPAYHWMFNWDGHNVCWGGRTTNYTAIYPSGLVSQIHTDGQIWATVNMKIWDVLGREKTDAAFLEGLALTNSSSNQNQAAIAVRQAAINMNYSCADIQVMTEKYTAAGYTMLALPLSITCPEDQTVNADASGTYTLPSFDTLTNAIVANCNATITQMPAVGTALSQGTHTITMTATSDSSVSCTFNLTVQAPLSNENFQLENALIMYPNPVNDNLTLKGNFDSIQKFSIFNTIGQKISEGIVGSQEMNINVSNFSNGVYFLKLDNYNKSYKFVKE